MASPVHAREVEEQLAEALPVLGQAALRQALGELQQMLSLCANPTYQMLLIWLWVEGYEQCGSLGPLHPGGFEITFPDGGADLVLKAQGVAIEIDLDPPVFPMGRHVATSAAIRANPRGLARQLIGELGQRIERQRRRAGPT